jgi:putative tryptophan/tyrosine transport system substrate-binding protein
VSSVECPVDGDREKDMKRKITVLTLCAMLLVLCVSAEAQQQAKVPKIGLLGARPAASSTGLELFRQALGKLGYIEGKNTAIEYQSADNKFDRLPALADELVRLKVDVIVTPGTAEALAAKNATTTIPIVFFGGGDPVAAGLVDSLARPGETSQGSPALGRCWLAND